MFADNMETSLHSYDIFSHFLRRDETTHKTKGKEAR